MRFELTKWNIEKAIKTLEGMIKGKSIMVGETGLYGVVSIGIEKSEWYDGDPIPEENYDGGKHDAITITFNFEKGSAVHSFCPDTEICHFWEETDDLVIFQIEDIMKYVERAKFDLDYKLKEYEEYMKK